MMIEGVFFRNLWTAYLVIPIMILLIFIVSKRFVKLGDRALSKTNAKVGRVLLVMSRTIIVLLLLFALAYPYTITEEESHGNPRIALLVDNSTSMSVFDMSFVADMKARLSEQIPTTIKYIGSGNNSDISNGIFSSLDSRNLVLVTDGNNYKGKELTDTLLFGMSKNASINLISMEPVRNEIGVSIEGPSKVVEGVENDFLIKINKVKTERVVLKVTVDDKVVIEKSITGDSMALKQGFEKGQHTIKAEISGDDTYAENNIFYKTVTVIDKPKVLFVTKQFSPITKILEKLYDLDITSSIPDKLDPYLTVMLNDLSSVDLPKDKVDTLTRYVNLGEGLVILGGENSFDYGNYKGSYIETLIPVSIAKGKEKPSKDVNVVLLLDRSGSTASRAGTGQLGVNLEKEIAINVIDQMDKENFVGVIAFNNRAEVLSELVSKDRFEEVKKRIIAMEPKGGTNMKEAVLMGIEMLKNKKGSRNIIIISDGKDKYISSYLGDIRDAAKEGIVTHTVNIGSESDVRNMEQIARVGNGNFFNPKNSEAVKVVFNKPKDKWPIMALPKNHFITNDMKLNSYISGFNQIVPKSTGIMLATTAFGDPLLTVGRYGLGRIAVLSTDDGRFWSSSVLKEDPKFISRIVNWAIENPERKKQYYVEIADMRVGETGTVYVKSGNMPQEEDLAFSKIDENMYSAEIGLRENGVHEALGTLYSVNYHPELARFGMNSEFIAALNSVDGSVFSNTDTEQIISRAQQASVELVSTQTSLRYFLIFPALALLLLEIIIRRIFRYRKLYK